MKKNKVLTEKEIRAEDILRPMLKNIWKKIIENYWDYTVKEIISNTIAYKKDLALEKAKRKIL